MPLVQARQAHQALPKVVDPPRAGLQRAQDRKNYQTAKSSHEELYTDQKSQVRDNAQPKVHNRPRQSRRKLMRQFQR